MFLGSCSVPQDNRLNPSGLWDGNPLSAPQGALLVADNVALRRPGVLESFPGRANLGGSLSGSETAERLEFYQDTLVIARSAGTLTRHDGTSTYTDFSGDYDKPDSDNKVRFAQAQRNLYFTSNAGLFRLDAPGGTPVAAGGPKARDWASWGEQTFLHSDGWLADQYAVGYRAVLCIRDASGRLVRGPSSGRLVLANDAGPTGYTIGYDSTAATTVLSLAIPPGLTTSHFVQLYRTPQVAMAIDPGDEMGLVLERAITSTDISNGAMQLLDITPDEMIGPTGYFCPSQEGILQSDEPPPLARDIAAFRNSLLLGNTVSRQRLFLTVIRASGPGSLTLTVGGLTYTGTTGSNDTSGNYNNGIGNGGFTGTTAQKIEFIARNLVDAINLRTGNTTLNAYYISGPDDAPGKILLEERAVGGSTLALTSNISWTGFLRVSPQSGVFDSDTRLNRAWWSKTDETDAVPLVNFQDLGSADKKLLRILPLKDSVLWFKEDGIWRMTGQGAGSFSFEPLDPTLILLSRDSLVAFENRAWGVFNKGVLAISESGASEPVGFTHIDETIRRLITTAPTQLAAYSWGLANEARREYELHLPNASSDTSTVQAFVYNAGTGAWTRKVQSRPCGIVSSGVGGRPYYGSSSNKIAAERNSGTSADFQDTAGAAIQEAFTFAPFTGGSPTAEKTFQGATFLFAGAIPTAATASFATPRSAVESTVLVLTNGTNPAIVPAELPATKCMGPYLTLGLSHSTAQEKLEFLGAVVDFQPVTQRGGR